MKYLLRRRVGAEVDEELRSHIELRADDLERGGLPRAEAERRARIEFGARERIKDEMHRASGGYWVSVFSTDVRHAVRALRKSPGYAAAAIATLGLGIGAVTAVFSMVDGVLLKPFAFRDPGRLVVVRETEREVFKDRPMMPDNYRHYARLRAATKTLEDAAIFQDAPVSVVQQGGNPRVVIGQSNSVNLLRVLGVQPVMGRDFTDGDGVKGANPVAVLSYAGWQELAGGNPNIVGQTMRLDGDPVTIIGVLGPGVGVPKISWGSRIKSPVNSEDEETMLYRPHVPSDWDLQSETGNFNYKVIGRLKPGVTPEQAQTELDGLQKSYSVAAKLPIHLGAAVVPLARDVTADVSGALWLMLAAVGAVLLIGCVNLANLQLARAVSAERETAVRSALGASRARLVSARLAESVVLALVGGALGVGLAYLGVQVLMALVPAGVPRIGEVRVNFPVLAFAAGLSMASAVAFGALPALRSLRVRPHEALAANTARVANTRKGRRARNLLVAGQVAGTVALLIVASLLLRSFSRLVGQQRGFASSQVTMAQVDLFTPQYGDKGKNVNAVKTAFADRAMEALRALPGVQHVAMTSAVPLTGETWVDLLERPDHPVPENEKKPINVRWISEDFVPAMQMPLVAGRNLTSADRNNPYVVLISQKTAQEGFAGENPLGKTLRGILPGANDQALTIVGVVADTRINSLKEDAAPMVYAPYWAFTPWRLVFMVTSTEPSDALAPAMRKAIWKIDPQVPIPSIKSMDEQVSASVATERFQTLVLTCFSGAALLLALLGIYGVLAYSVSLRQVEFGVRMALGSGRRQLMQLVLGQAAQPVLLGAGVGLVVALVAARWIRSMLFETQVLDPTAIAGSLLLLTVAAALAAILPARRAAHIDPAKAIRNE